MHQTGKFENWKMCFLRKGTVHSNRNTSIKRGVNSPLTGHPEAQFTKKRQDKQLFSFIYKFSKQYLVSPASFNSRHLYLK